MKNTSNLGITNARKRDTSYKSKPQVKNSFDSNSKELLSNVEALNKIELLSKTNKSIVIPANVWCDFHAVLYASDNDYSYELIEEILSVYKTNHNLTNNGKYKRRLERLEDDEIEKIESKKK